MNSNHADDNSITNLSHGEEMYIKYGVRGIKWEASNGFPTLFNIAVEVMEKCFKDNYNINDAGVYSLVHIMSEIEDSNVIYRASYEKMNEIHKQCKDILKINVDIKSIKMDLLNLDSDFIRENISPGGSADVLAMAYFICFLQEEGLLKD